MILMAFLNVMILGGFCPWTIDVMYFIYLFILKIMYLFIFGCVGSSFLC